MPKIVDMYTFICDDCEGIFSAELKIDGDTHQCPHCGSKDTWCEEEDD